MGGRRVVVLAAITVRVEQPGVAVIQVSVRRVQMLVEVHRGEAAEATLEE